MSPIPLLLHVKGTVLLEVLWDHPEVAWMLTIELWPVVHPGPDDVTRDGALTLPWRIFSLGEEGEEEPSRWSLKSPPSGGGGKVVDL